MERKKKKDAGFSPNFNFGFYFSREFLAVLIPWYCVSVSV